MLFSEDLELIGQPKNKNTIILVRINVFSWVNLLDITTKFLIFLR